MAVDQEPIGHFGNTTKVSGRNIAGVTNGYIFYTPRGEQLAISHGAQEDCDWLVAPEWHPLFEAKVAEILERL